MTFYIIAFSVLLITGIMQICQWRSHRKVNAVGGDPGGKPRKCKDCEHFDFLDYSSSRRFVFDGRRIYHEYLRDGSSLGYVDIYETAAGRYVAVIDDSDYSKKTILPATDKDELSRKLNGAFPGGKAELGSPVYYGATMQREGRHALLRDGWIITRIVDVDAPEQKEDTTDDDRWDPMTPRIGDDGLDEGVESFIMDINTAHTGYYGTEVNYAGRKSNEAYRKAYMQHLKEAREVVDCPLDRMSPADKEISLETSLKVLGVEPDDVRETRRP